MHAARSRRITWTDSPDKPRFPRNSVRALCGFEVSSTQVERATQGLDTELQAWRERPLGEIPYVILDARYEKVRQGGAVIDCAVLIAVGVTPQGKRSILGVSVSLSEAEVANAVKQSSRAAMSAARVG